MRINSSRNSLARARMLRSASRKGRAKALSSRNSSTTNKTNKTNKTTNSSNTTTSKQITLYENVEKTAKALQTTVGKLAEYAAKTSDTETQNSEKKRTELTAQIEEFVKDYNSMYNALGEAGGTTFELFQKQIKSATSAVSEDLEAVGITSDKTGKLSVDTKKLEAADIQKLQKLFCVADSYASQISSKCETVESCASSTIKVLNRMYGTQTSYNKYGTNSYFYGSSGSWYSANG